LEKTCFFGLLMDGFSGLFRTADFGREALGDYAIYSTSQG
jgi:hypothetical protein